jgi:hypothetical protein
MEAPETFVIIKRWWLLRFRDEDREETKDDKRSWMVPLAALGLLIIVAGIVIETYAEDRVSHLDGLLRIHESDKITAAEGEAAEATKQAGSAALSAERAGDASGRAQNKADIVGLEANEAERKIADVKKRADVLTWVLSARRVQDADGLEKDLREKFKGRHITFSSYVGDEEPFWLCSQLADIAQNAGVVSTHRCATEPISGFPIADLHVVAPTIEEAMNLARVFEGPNRVLGLGASLNIGDELKIFVGPKQSIPLLTKPKAADRKSVRP